MNLYVRYFSNEAVVKTADEALDFLATIPEIRLENSARNRINTFIKSSNLYPFRLKVTYSNYVLFLKTEAETLEQFKEEEAMRRAQKNEDTPSISERKKTIMDALNAEKKGWWLTSLKFKRVITMPHSGKCQYVDTTFTVRQIANSAMDAYNRLIDHLKSRSDVDPRSQFPSAKSANFEYQFLETIATEQETDKNVPEYTEGDTKQEGNVPVKEDLQVDEYPTGEDMPQEHDTYTEETNAPALEHVDTNDGDRQETEQQEASFNKGDRQETEQQEASFNKDNRQEEIY